HPPFRPHPPGLTLQPTRRILSIKAFMFIREIRNMTTSLLKYSVAGAMAGMLCLVGISTFAQQGGGARASKAAEKPTPKMADGHPDFTGFWLRSGAGINYGADAGASEDGNLTRLPDGSTIFLYGGAVASVANEGPVSNAVPAN